MSTQFQFTWNDKLAPNVVGAVDRGMARSAANAARTAKGAAHVRTGRLRRSIHAARAGYDGSHDHAVATTTNIPPEGFGFELGNPKGSKLDWVVGSWVTYAVYERARGGGHDFLSGAFAEAKRTVLKNVADEVKNVR